MRTSKNKFGEMSDKILNAKPENELGMETNCRFANKKNKEKKKEIISSFHRYLLFWNFNELFPFSEEVFRERTIYSLMNSPLNLVPSVRIK